MTERPIIFSGPMVKALLDGRKTQTRRLATSPLRKVEPGDRLWVRECFAEVGNEGHLIVTRADYPACVPSQYHNLPTESAIKWRPSIHMPRWASRLTLAVTAVRFERLNDISRTDAEAEGIEGRPFHWVDYLDPMREFSSPISSYRSLWSKLHGPDGAWDHSVWANPWVVAITFTVDRR